MTAMLLKRVYLIRSPETNFYVTSHTYIVTPPYTLPHDNDALETSVPHPESRNDVLTYMLTYDTDALEAGVP